MTTITIQFDDTTKLKKIFDFFRRLNVPFQILDPKSKPETLWEPHVHAIIQQRLIEKYVKTGEWEEMSDEDRQDASELEKMLWQKEQADYQVYSETETKDYITQLKKDLYEISGH